MKVSDYLVANTMSYMPLRTESLMATGFRLAQYPDGTQKLQGAYEWAEGFKSGFIWKDMPVVEVNIHGQVPNDD